MKWERSGCRSITTGIDGSDNSGEGVRIASAQRFCLVLVSARQCENDRMISPQTETLLRSLVEVEADIQQ